MGSPAYRRFLAAVTTAYLCAVGISTPGVAAVEATEVWQKIDSHRSLSVSEDARYEDAGDSGILTEGSLLIMPNGNFQLNTPQSQVNTKHNSLLFVRAHRGTVHVFVLLGNASVQVGNVITPIASGEEAIVADHKYDVNQEVLQEDLIARRRLIQSSSGNGTYLGLAEFSLVHAADHERLLYHLFHSRDPHDRALRERLIKTAAVLTKVTSSHGGYISPTR
jgi:hypothetical protein